MTAMQPITPAQIWKALWGTDPGRDFVGRTKPYHVDRAGDAFPDMHDGQEDPPWGSPDVLLMHWRMEGWETSDLLREASLVCGRDGVRAEAIVYISLEERGGQLDLSARCTMGQIFHFRDASGARVQPRTPEGNVAFRRLADLCHDEPAIQACFGHAQQVVLGMVVDRIGRPVPFGWGQPTGLA
jgi:hypothetical protein